jgi:hypothetical protein
MRLMTVALLGWIDVAYGQETPPIETSTAAGAPACSAAYDCNIGFVCRDGGCIDGRGVACQGDGDCAGGDSCVLGICAVPARTAPAASSGCTVDRDCPGDLICQANACVEPAASCQTDRDCPGDKLCEARTCVAPPEGCKTDRDCEGALICEAGRCLEPVKPKAPAATVTTPAQGPACKGLGGNECPRGMVCRYFRCQPPPEPDPTYYEPFRIGFASLFRFPRTGNLRTFGNIYDFGADLVISMNRIFRFHFQLAGFRTSGASGARAAPLVLGFAIPILSKAVRLEVEIVAVLVQAELFVGEELFEDFHERNEPPRVSFALSSGLRIQAVVGWGPLFAAVMPAGLEMRHFALDPGFGGSDVQTGVALDQSLMFTVGYEN